MEVLLKVVMLLCFIVLPLFPARRGKGNKSATKENPEEISNYGVAEDGHIILIDEGERKKVNDNRQL
jgi:hypothetical protein